MVAGLDTGFVVVGLLVVGAVVVGLVVFLAWRYLEVTGRNPEERTTAGVAQ